MIHKSGTETHRVSVNWSDYSVCYKARIPVGAVGQESLSSSPGYLVLCNKNRWCIFQKNNVNLFLKVYQLNIAKGHSVSSAISWSSHRVVYICDYIYVIIYIYIYICCC